MTVQNSYLKNLIQSDDGEIGKLMVQIAGEMIDAGTRLAPGIRLCCKNKEFSIECRGDSDIKEPLLEVPSSCFLPLTKFKLALGSNHQIVLSHCDKDVSPLQAELMRLQVELFNVAGKVQHYAINSTAAVLGLDHPLHRSLSATRGLVADAKEMQISSPPMRTGQDQNSLLGDFLQSRTFAVSPGSSQSMLVPLADFLNHDRRARTTHSSPEGLRVAIDRVLEHSQKCFLNYGKSKDTVDMFRYYHFVPMDLIHAISVPAIVPVADWGCLHIHGVVGSRSKTESSLLKKLPRFLALEGEVVSCENISISELPEHDTMEVGVDFMVKMLGKAKGCQVTKAIIAETKVKLLKANTEHYRELIRLAEREPKTALNKELLANIVQMSECQLALLGSYAINKSLQ